MPLSLFPRLDGKYRARDLPPRSVVRSGSLTEYVVSPKGLLMRWEQPIPGSESWEVTYVGRVGPDEWMTPRERAEVDEANQRFERHTSSVSFRLSPRLEGDLNQLAEREKTSVSEIVREALATRWGLK